MSQLIPREKFENLKHFFGVTKPLALFKVDPDKYWRVFRNVPRKDLLGYQPVAAFSDSVSVDAPYTLFINKPSTYSRCPVPISRTQPRLDPWPILETSTQLRRTQRTPLPRQHLCHWSRSLRWRRLETHPHRQFNIPRHASHIAVQSAIRRSPNGHHAFRRTV